MVGGFGKSMVFATAHLFGLRFHGTSLAYITVNFGDGPCSYMEAPLQPPIAKWFLIAFGRATNRRAIDEPSVFVVSGA